MTHRSPVLNLQGLKMHSDLFERAQSAYSKNFSIISTWFGTKLCKKIRIVLIRLSNFQFEFEEKKYKLGKCGSQIYKFELIKQQWFAKRKTKLFPFPKASFSMISIFKTFYEETGDNEWSLYVKWKLIYRNDSFLCLVLIEFDLFDRHVSIQ